MHSDWCGRRGKIGGGILIWEGGGSCLNWDLWDLWDLWDKQDCDLAASQFSVSLWGLVSKTACLRVSGLSRWWAASRISIVGRRLGGVVVEGDAGVR